MLENELSKVFSDIWLKGNERNWIAGRLGVYNGADANIDIVGKPGYVVVTTGFAGDQGVTMARDAVGTARTNWQLIRMRREKGELVIWEAELYSGTEGTGGSDALADLTDVTITSPINGNILRYNGAVWVNAVPSGGGSTTFMGLTDVQASGWDNGEIPVWNASISKLIPGSLPPGTAYAGGNGIGISGANISIRQQPTGSALEFNGLGEVLVGRGNGIGLSGNTLIADLKSDGGLEFSGTQIRIKLATNSGLIVDVNGITLNSAIAGAGLTLTAAKVMSVGTSDTTISVAADTIAVNQNSAFLWTGLHTFRTDPQIENDIDFVSAVNHNIIATNSLFLKPAAELVFDPGTLITYPSSQESKMVGALDSVSGIKGFRIWDYSLPSGTANTMMLTITAIKADEIFVRKFTADEARVRRGEWFLAYSYGDVQEDFTMPAIGVNVDVWFEEAPGLGTLSIFQPNDWIKLRTVDMTSVNLATSVWFQAVGNYLQRQNADAANNIPSRQQWRLVRRNGGATNQAVKRGETMVDFGAIGQGMIEMSALAESGGPFIRTALFDSVVSQVPNFKARVQMGRLSGTVDYATNVRWGFAAGNDLSLTPAFGFSGVTIDDVAGARFFNTDIRLYEASIISTFLSRTYGLSILNDTAMFANNLRNIAWYDSLPADGNLAPIFATAKIGTWGGTSDRRLQLDAYGTDLSAIFLRAVGDSGADMGSIAIKGGGWYGLTGGVIEMGAQYITNVTPDVLGDQRARFRVGGDSGSTARTNFHVYVKDGGQLDTTGMMMEQAGSGDTSFHWKLTGGQQFVAGIDHTTNTFKIKAGNTLRGGLASIEINPTTGVVTINGLSGSGTGTLVATAGDGLTLTGTEFKVNSTVARSYTTIGTLPGSGLQGGGDLGGNRTLSVDTTVVRTGRAIISDSTAITIAAPGTLVSDVHIGFVLAANSGLNQTAGLAVDALIAGTGLTFTGGKINAIAGYGIIVTADAISVDPGILPILSSYVAGTGMTRSGTAPNFTFDVIAGNTSLTVGADSIILNDSYVLSTVMGQRQISPGAGLTGGGFLNATVLLALDNAYVLSNTLAGRSIIAGDGLLGTGTLNNNITIDFKGGTGLIVTADLVKLDDAYVISNILINRSVIAGDGLSGGGTLNNNVTLDVVAGDGSLTVSASAVIVNRAFAFDWTGAHTWGNTVAFGGAATFLANATFNATGIVQFNSTPQVNANLNFMIDAAITTTGVFNLNLAPGGDIILSPMGTDPDVLPRGSSVVDLGDYNRKWRSFYAAEMIVGNIVSADVMATVGGNVRVGPTSVLLAPFLIGATTIDLKHNSFAQYTYLILETVSGASSTAQTEVIRVTSVTPTTLTVGFRYTVTRNHNALGEKDWQAGDAVFSLGRIESNGYVDIASVDTVLGHIGPTVTVYARKADPTAGTISSQTWNNLRPVTAMGNLSSFAGVSGTKYGFAAANDLTLGPSTGLSGIVITSTGTELYNTAIRMTSGSNVTLSIEPSLGISLEATPASGSPFNKMNRIDWFTDLDTRDTALPLAFIQTTGKDVANDVTLALQAGSGDLPDKFDGIIILRANREDRRMMQLFVHSAFDVADTSTAGVTTWLIHAADSDGIQLNRATVIQGARNNETQLRVARVSTEASIMGNSDWLVMDGHRGASGPVGINFYSSGNVIIAYGGGKVGIGTGTPGVTEPYDRLSVEGNNALAVGASIINTGAGQAALVLRRTGTVPSRMAWYIPGGFDEIRMYAGTSAQDVMTINPYAVGIATTTPQANLDVKGVQMNSLPLSPNSTFNLHMIAATSSYQKFFQMMSAYNNGYFRLMYPVDNSYRADFAVNTSGLGLGAFYDPTSTALPFLFSGASFQFDAQAGKVLFLVKINVVASQTLLAGGTITRGAFLVGFGTSNAVSWPINNVIGPNGSFSQGIAGETYLFTASGGGLTVARQGGTATNTTIMAWIMYV
jgi:hypothetical protein